MTERTTYAFEGPRLDRTAATRVCGAVMSALRPAAGIALIDAFSDYEPDGSALEAQTWLRELSRRKTRRGIGMGIELDPTDEDHWWAFASYAAWSIHAALFVGRWYGHLATFHDCGYSITAALTDVERSQLTAALSDLGTWTTRELHH